jgi:uncharacterized protein (TIGR02217 family)
MSNLIYPNLVGLAFNVVRRPKGNTSVETHVSGRETRLGYWTYPMYEWDLTYSVLRDFIPCPGFTIPSELKRLEGFFLAVQGSLLGFYFQEPDDDHVVGQYLGTGDGTTTDFLLVRTWGDPTYTSPPSAGLPFNSATVTEPVGDIDPAPSVFYLNGLQQLAGAYTIKKPSPYNSSVSFVTAPAAGVVVTADLWYYFYVRFKDDTLDFEKFSGPPGAGFWMIKKLTLVSLRGT